MFELLLSNLFFRIGLQCGRGSLPFCGGVPGVAPGTQTLLRGVCLQGLPPPKELNLQSCLLDRASVLMLQVVLPSSLQLDSRTNADQTFCNHIAGR